MRVKTFDFENQKLPQKNCVIIVSARIIYLQNISPIVVIYCDEFANPQDVSSE